MTDTPPWFRRRRFATVGAGAALLGAALLGGATGAYMTDRADADEQVAAEPGAARFQRTSLTERPSAPLADMVEAVSPSVVQVQARPSAPVHASSGESPFGELFGTFSGEAPSSPPRGQTVGSGFIVDATGIIVTNAHVVEGADEVGIKLSDGRELAAAVVGRDEKTDLAVLRLKGRGRFQPVAWGDSKRLRAGEDVVAVGSPFGLGNTVTKGIVSGRGRAIGAGPYDDFLQIDAPINAGNSGGPLFDASGRVVGVNTAIYSPSGGNVGIGFAIPSEMARKVVAQLASKGEVTRGEIGVSIQPLTPEIAAGLGLDNTRGVLVADIAVGSPAEQAGLQPGDVIRSFDGTATTTPQDLLRAVAAARIGDTVSLVLIRGGRTHTVSVRILRPGEPMAAEREGTGDSVSGAPGPRLGLMVVPAAPALNEEAGQPADTRGVFVVEVDPQGRAGLRGVVPGDIIIAVGTQAVRTPDALVTAMREAAGAGRRSVLLDMVRGGQRLRVSAPLA